ncbi:MAG: hypothetical protein Salg2KO_04610 [Salibacteraceae bacterium]
MKLALLALISMFLTGSLWSQTSQDYSVLMEAEAIESPLSIKLTWDDDANATAYFVYRKEVDALSFGAPIATLGAVTTYTDTDISEGEEYEYYVRKSATGYTGHGYTHSGVNVLMKAERGNALILVESMILDSLPQEIQQLEMDMMADGWKTAVKSVSSDTTVAHVKDIIENWSDEVLNEELVYLVGHVPVPYSGNLAPDAHNNHIGAWPSDVYYAELDGNWTDNGVNNTTASDPRNHNIPGDGKFDQSQLPNEADLMIGRVDFANMSVFSQDEIELTRRYLHRVHEYKSGNWDLPKKAIIDDNFGGFNGEAFAGNGWRNFSPLVGRNAINPSDYRATLDTAGHLFSYGCGGGSFTSANGIGNSTQLAGDSLLTGFTMLFGSYFGDWDRPNNFMRAALAQGRTMSISWAGRPHWHYQSFGLGYPLGYSARLTQNNEGAYFYSYGDQFVHIALLGDPTLRMEYPSPPFDLTIDTTEVYHINLSWTASEHPNLDGYNVYRKNVLDQWVLLNEGPISGLSYTDSCVIDKGWYTYQVKAVEKLENFSGSYWNTSLGLIDSIEVGADKYADGIGYFFEDFGSDPISGRFIAHSVSPYTTSIEWTAEGNVLTGDTVEYETSLAAGENFVYFGAFTNECSYSGFSQSITLNVEDRITEQDLTIYPNPVVSGQSIHIASNEGVMSASLFTLDGMLLATPTLNGNTLSLPILASGVYMVEIITEQKTTLNRLIVR